ncbi:DUF4376 domain-containing protein [Stenotrophomonas sp. PS02297]|uniref:DUF4376 domain-containing protein n=1 Tax=Stenotrophomonas sp. PS02297 TaxID=2991423 RepID=UPI00249A673D|nr:DUF4376 domain-containing protein [Stenotrophomonas sp. PS02297]
MSRVALIRSGVVANVIEADLAFAATLPGYDTAMEAGTAGPGWLLVEGALVPPPAPPPAQTLEEAKQQLRERATALRWERETGGITVGGVRVLTGIEDQNRIATALVGAPATLDFKADSGWVTLTLAELQAIAAAITTHVQACFTAERAHHEAIDALPSLAAVAAYDVEAGWP